MSQTNSGGTGRDQSGMPFSTPGTGPVPDGAPVTIHTSNGPVPGRLVSGEAVADKK